MSERGVLGVSRARPDSEPKVRAQSGSWPTGVSPAGSRLGRCSRPTPTRPSSGSISAAALSVPGVVAVLTAADLGLRGGNGRLAMPLAGAEVVFAGQPVALVIAETPEAAADAAELVDVRYEPLPVVLDPERAMEPAAALARHDRAVAVADGPAMDAGTHAGVGGEGDRSIDDEVLSSNVVGRTRYRRGDATAGLEAAAVRVRHRFRTSWVHQGYLEPLACAAWVDDDGTLVVESSTQGIFALRKDVARALGRPTHGVRVIPAPLGGGFGAKWALFETLVAAAAQRVERPVRLVLERREDFLIANPSQAFVLDVEIGAGSDGRFTALRARIVADTGAFEDFSADELAGIMVGGPYRWPAVDVSAYGVRTNRVGGGAYRGPSGPPTAFAIESPSTSWPGGWASIRSRSAAATVRSPAT